jgi:predicted N-acetyltransferase YhbS
MSVGHTSKGAPSSTLSNPQGDSGDSGEAQLRLDIIDGPEQMSQLSALLDEAFNAPASGDYLSDFPVWNQSIGPGPDSAIRIGVFDGDQLVACSAVRLASLRVPAGDLKVGLIGAVATSPSHRGKGLASRTVSLAVEWARERGAAMAMLWGQETSLYERLGFELCGMQVRAPLAELDLGPKPRDLSNVILGRGWVPTLMRSLRTRGSGLRIASSDERWIEAHSRVQWYWLGDPEAPMAYAAIDRGLDLQGVVHEWGGESEAALKLLLQLVRMERPEAQLLGNPALFGAYNIGASPSGHSPKTSEIEFLCMARALDVAKIISAHGIVLSADDAMLTTPNAAVCRRLFGPAENALPLWIWGLDAV